MSSINHPLLVKVQSVNIHNLDFKTGGAFKTRNITYVESSNSFLLIGLTSGSVFVFSRSSLTLLYLIPFKFGRVCSLSLTSNEEILAIASLRGIVSIYKLGSGGGNNFKFLYSVEHHKGNEVTEVHWSSNGNYLFVGDSQGLVSQVDVGGVSEFPRPVSLSQVILMLKSRILQIHFIFPFIAVSTLSSVYLCDIEKEDFSQIKVGGESLQPNGIALLSLNETTSALFVSSTPYIYSFSLQGVLLHKVKLELVNFSHSFDPLLIPSSTNGTHSQNHSPPTTSSTNSTNNTSPNSTNNTSSNNTNSTNSTNTSSTNSTNCTNSSSSTKNSTNITNSSNSSGTNGCSVTLGKLLVTDDNLVLSLSNNHLYLIEPMGFQVVSWTDEFSRIQNCKILSNYLFISSPTTATTLSLTAFRPYGKQLFDGGLFPILDSWIHHTLSSVGYNSQNEWEFRERKIAKNKFKSLLSLHDYSTEFGAYLAQNLPFEIGEETGSLYYEPLNNLRNKLQKLSQPVEIESLFESLSKFYSSLHIIFSKSEDNTQEDLLNLKNIVGKVSNFLAQTNNLNLYNELQEMKNGEILCYFENFLISLIKQIQNSEEGGLDCILDNQESPLLLFSKFIKKRSYDVENWFGSFSILSSKIFSESLIADIFLHFSPLISPSLKKNLLDEIVGKNGNFSAKILSILFFTSKKSPLHENLAQLIKSSSKEESVSKFSQIYKNIVEEIEDISKILPILHLVLDVIYFQNYFTNPQIFSLLLNNFPLKNYLSPEIIYSKIFSLCSNSSRILTIFHKSTLLLHENCQTCACKIPLHFPKVQKLSNLQNHANFQNFERICEQVVLNLLENGQKFEYGMLCGQFSQILEKYSEFCEENALIELILRSSSCHFLNLFKMSEGRLKKFLAKREFLYRENECENCGQRLNLGGNYEKISIQCIGLWVLDQSKNLDNFYEVMSRNVDLCSQSSGIFSLEFYQTLIEWKEKSLTKKIKKGASNEFRTLCNSFHSSLSSTSTNGSNN